MMGNLLPLTISILLLGVLSTCCVLAATSDLEITEFLASNNAGILDEDGESSDWIEIHNGGSDAVNLVGLHLTDDIGDPNQWTFPSFDLAADAYLVVFASGKDRTAASALHTNFRLGAGGEYLGLYDSDATTVLSEYRPEYPAQSTDRSYGIDSTGSVSFFSTPSPGQANGVGDPPVAAVVVASMDRGFYSEPFSVVLETSTLLADIRYTLDGSEPTADSGFPYNSPIVVSTTTVIRAAAFHGFASVLPSPTSTYSYIFLENVIQQPAEIPGFPNGVLHNAGINSNPVPQDFAMDPEVVAEYSDEIIDSMRSIPTMAITASTDAIFNPESGFYFTSDIENVASMEILDANDASKNEQIDVGVEGHSRNMQKRSFRLNWRSDYGNREWITEFFRDNAPLNAATATDTHRTLILRSGNNRCWARTSGNPDKTTYAIDEFYRASYIAMTGSGSRGTFVHLYLNGVYWGVYNLVERPDEQFQAAYFGGDDDDWYYTNHGRAGNADSTRWDYLVGPLVKKDMNEPGNYAEIQEFLNVERFCDYMILGFWLGTTDWPANNWYVANRNAVSPLGATRSEFYAWDGELSLDAFYFDRNEGLVGLLNKLELVPGSPRRDGASIRFEFRNNVGGGEEILRIWNALWFDSAEFRALFDERVTVQTGAGGALTDEAMIQRWDTLNAYIESAIVGESARWGDSLKSKADLGSVFNITRTRDIDWQTQVDKIRGLLDGNTQQFLDEYSELVSPTKLSTKIFRFLLKLIPDKFRTWFYDNLLDDDRDPPLKVWD